MSHALFTKDVPSDVPGARVEREDMARVTDRDWRRLSSLARGYCRTVDATRSRKRADGSATVARGGYGLYGTDDVCDDVTQDAVFLFAQKLSQVINSCDVAPQPVDSDEVEAWFYLCKDGRKIVVTRETLRRWAVRDAAARNGYRLDVPPDAVDAEPGFQLIGRLRHAEHLATASYLAGASEEIMRVAWGDGQDFPHLEKLIKKAETADDLGRMRGIGELAQELYGGAYGSSRKVAKVSRDARAEWTELSARLDAARDSLAYDAARHRKRDEATE